jgi:3-deoxy-manno-octulosonate cytidylyltransferase (CMP-KDO synthetase)
VHPEIKLPGTLTVAATRVIAIIPARFGSTRLPGKPLAKIAGRPMIEHVYRRVEAASSVENVMVATDDKRIARAVTAFGGAVRMTRHDHLSGTDRLAEVASTLDCDIVVNVQADEPLIEPAMVDAAVSCLQAPEVLMSTLRCPLRDTEDMHNPNVVKVAVDRNGYALFFSRAPIGLPHSNDRDRPVPVDKHIGLYAYRRSFLMTLSDLDPTPLECAERLEQLRALEHGYRIMTIATAHDPIGVNTPADLDHVRRLLSTRASV